MKTIDGKQSKNNEDNNSPYNFNLNLRKIH